MQSLRACLCVVVAIVVAGAPKAASAEFKLPSAVPIDRVIQNVEARLQANQEDLDATYTLARAHYLAFVYKSNKVPAFERSRASEPGSASRIDVASRWMTEDGRSEFINSIELNQRAQELATKELGISPDQALLESERLKFRTAVDRIYQELVAAKWQREKLDAVDALAHGRKSLELFTTLLAKQPNNALYQIGLASFYKQYVEFRKEGLQDEPAELKAITMDTAIDAFYKAYLLAIAKDKSTKSIPLAGLADLVSYEAGKQYIELTQKYRPRPTAEQAAKLRQVQADIKKFDGLPRGAVTPIILCVDRSATLAELIDKKLAVKFDLDGDEVAERWSWVRPRTGILVWDPEGAGRITSGKQLFGNATWWLLFADGYRALDTLDDDRDGYVAGRELRGLAVWFDRNSNGESEAGEVIPVDRLGIRALGTRPDGEELGGPKHSRGMLLEDGRVLPTYDWVAERMTK